mmetsp:Transcript_48857/g.139893  ORF Transcript_48857/g.139893 Transcript_48857/m.139893 type:complete len:249 (+) Transcript_48857:716-1462(+)
MQGGACVERDADQGESLQVRVAVPVALGLDTQLSLQLTRDSLLRWHRRSLQQPDSEHSSPISEHTAAPNMGTRVLQLHGVWCSGGSMGFRPGAQLALQPAQYASFSKHSKPGSTQQLVSLQSSPLSEQLAEGGSGSSGQEALFRVGGSWRIAARTKSPESVRWHWSQPPAPLAPGMRAEQLSRLSPIAQLASEMLCRSKKSSQACASFRSREPSPVASHVPHSVAKMAMPLAMACTTFSRSHCRCVLA